MTLVMDDLEKEGIRSSDSRPQVFIAGTSGFETGAKAIRKDDYKLQASGAGISVIKAGAKTAASAHEDAMDMLHEASMDILPNHVIFAMPQGTSLGPEYYG